MADYAFLIGRPDGKPLFEPPRGEEGIAYAVDWIPLGWLAMFVPGDIQVVAQPPDPASHDPDEDVSCPTLIRSRDAALEALRRRRARLERVIPSYLQPQLNALEAAVKACPDPYIQVALSDLDFYASFKSAARDLGLYVAAMDSDNAQDWRLVLSQVFAKMGRDFSEIEFPKADVAAVAGYLPKQFAVPISKPVSEAKATKPAKPWWRFW